MIGTLRSAHESGEAVVGLTDAAVDSGRRLWALLGEFAGMGGVHASFASKSDLLRHKAGAKGMLQCKNKRAFMIAHEREVPVPDHGLTG